MNARTSGRFDGEEDDDEAGAVPKPDVGLQSGDAELGVRSGHHVHDSPLEADAKARAVVDVAAGDPRETAFHRLDRRGGREKLVDVGFAQEERHPELVRPA